MCTSTLKNIEWEMLLTWIPREPGASCSSSVSTTALASMAGWPSSEYSKLCEIKLLIPDWIFSTRSSECRVCIHCNSSPTNWSVVENIFLNDLVLPGRSDERLCKSSQIVELHWSVSKHVHSFLVIIIIESNTTSVKRTINNSKTNVGVVTNHVEIRSGPNYS